MVFAYIVYTSALFFLLNLRLSTDAALNGEELAASYRDPVFFNHRLIADSYASNYSFYAFNSVINSILPYNVYSTRIVATITNGLIAPALVGLLFLILSTVSSLTVILFVLLLSLSPNLMWFNIHAIEPGSAVAIGLFLLNWSWKFPVFSSDKPMP